MNRLRVGIAGLGRMGRRHAENLARRVPQAELVAACDPSPDERAWAERHLDVARCYSEYSEMLAQPDLEAVFLVTPTTLHAQQIVDALRARKHVFSEKPLSLDELAQLALLFQSQWRREPTPEEFNRLVESKVQEEILYREALAMGLDKDDTIVKRRMAQKMQFLAEDVAARARADHGRAQELV